MGRILNGGRLVVGDEDIIFNTTVLKETIQSKRVNTMFITSALFNMHVSKDPTVFSTMKYVLSGGEKMSEQHAHIFKDNNKNVALINAYGPTENTTFTTTY